MQQCCLRSCAHSHRSTNLVKHHPWSLISHTSMHSMGCEYPHPADLRCQPQLHPTLQVFHETLSASTAKVQDVLEQTCQHLTLGVSTYPGQRETLTPKPCPRSFCLWECNTQTSTSSCVCAGARQLPGCCAHQSEDAEDEPSLLWWRQCCAGRTGTWPGCPGQ